jgi:hypothetical protein
MLNYRRHMGGGIFRCIVASASAFVFWIEDEVVISLFDIARLAVVLGVSW